MYNNNRANYNITEIITRMWLFAFPLYLTFNLIIKTNTYPVQWKLTKIFSIHKSGDTGNIRNYRSISLLCTPSNILESVIYDRLFHHIKSYISLEQHGFMPKRLTNVINFTTSLYHTLSKNLSNGCYLYRSCEGVWHSRPWYIIT